MYFEIFKFIYFYLLGCPTLMGLDYSNASFPMGMLTSLTADEVSISQVLNNLHLCLGAPFQSGEATMISASMYECTFAHCLTFVTIVLLFIFAVYLVKFLFTFVKNLLP